MVATFDVLWSMHPKPYRFRVSRCSPRRLILGPMGGHLGDMNFDTVGEAHGEIHVKIFK